MEYDYREAMKLENQLCFPIYAAARNITSMYTPYLKPLGLTYTQYILFLVLWERDGLTVGEICRKLMLDSGTLSPILKKLRTEGYIEKNQSTEDERSYIITLTEKGSINGREFSAVFEGGKIKELTFSGQLRCEF